MKRVYHIVLTLQQCIVRYLNMGVYWCMYVNTITQLHFFLYRPPPGKKNQLSDALFFEQFPDFLVLLQ